MKSEFDLAVLNGYWMWRDDLVTNENFIEYMNRMKRQENEGREKRKEDIPWNSKPESEPIKKKIDHRKYPNHVRKKKTQKYPDEMKGFVERHMMQNSNKQLCDLIKDKFNININTNCLANYMFIRRLKRKNNIKKKLKKPEMKKEKIDKGMDPEEALDGEEELEDPEIDDMDLDDAE